AGADVGGRARDFDAPVRAQDCPGARRHLHRFPDAGGHAPSDEFAALAHRTRLRLSLRPAQPLGALAVALAQLFAAERLILDLILVRVVDQPQLKRIEPGRMGEFVHRAFDRIEAFGAARRAHVAGGVVVELNELLAGFDIGALVELARPADAVALEILEARGHADERVAERGQAAVALSRQPQQLAVAAPL